MTDIDGPYPSAILPGGSAVGMDPVTDIGSVHQSVCGAGCTIDHNACVCGHVEADHTYCELSKKADCDEWCDCTGFEADTP